MKEKLAEYVHNTWLNWMQYLFSLSKTNTNASVTIPRKLVNRW